MEPARMLGRIAVAMLGVATVAVVATLSGGSAAATPAAPAASGVPAAALAAQAAQAALAAPQTLPTETHFVPITPCRIVNTQVAGGRLVNGTTRTFVVAGTSGFSGQGGTAGGCGIPLGATAVSVNLTANLPVGHGYLRAWPSTISAEPTGGVLTYPDGIGVTGSSIVSIAPGIAASLRVRNHSGSTYLVVDVTGYFVAPIEGLVSGSDHAIIAGSSRIRTVTSTAAGIAEVTIDRDVTYCTAAATAYGGTGNYAGAVPLGGNRVAVYTWYIDPTSHLPVPGDMWVYLTVIC